MPDGGGGGSGSGAESGHERPDFHAENAHGSAVSVVRTPADAPQMQIGAKHPRRAEMTAGAMFTIATLSFALFGGAYVQNANNYWLGGTLGGGLLLVGCGMIVWGKYLMPRGPFEEERHLMAVEPQQRAGH